MTNRTRSDSPTKTCTIAGCDRALRARGLCATHYNQTHHAGRHDPKPTTCEVCGKPIERRADGRRRPTCSVECRTTVQHGHAEPTASTYDWSSSAVLRAAQHGAQVIERFDRHEVFDRDGWTCQECGCTCVDPSPFALASATVDHIVPLSQGGNHTLANAQTLCLSCNSTKQDRAA